MQFVPFFLNCCIDTWLWTEGRRQKYTLILYEGCFFFLSLLCAVLWTVFFAVVFLHDCEEREKDRVRYQMPEVRPYFIRKIFYLSRSFALFYGHFFAIVFLHDCEEREEDRVKYQKSTQDLATTNCVYTPSHLLHWTNCRVERSNWRSKFLIKLPKTRINTRRTESLQYRTITIL